MQSTIFFARLFCEWKCFLRIIKIHLRMFIACVLNIKHHLLDSRREFTRKVAEKTLQAQHKLQSAPIFNASSSCRSWNCFQIAFNFFRGSFSPLLCSEGLTTHMKCFTCTIEKENSFKAFGCKKCRIYFYGIAINWHTRKIKRKSMSFEFSFVPKNYRSVYEQGWLCMGDFSKCGLLSIDLRQIKCSL